MTNKKIIRSGWNGSKAPPDEKISDEKLYVVYCHTNIMNNKKYIGITCQETSQRFRNGKGYKSSPHFYNAIKAYGWDGFTHEILAENLSEDEAKSKEIELIAKHKTTNPEFGYNITPGGDGCSGADNPWFGKHHTEETRKRMSEMRTGIPKTKEWKRKIGESNKGKKVSDEARQKMRENHADFTGENNPRYGTKLSKDHIDKLVKASKTPEAIEKMRQHKTWHSGSKNPNSKKVICLDTGKIYDTINEAAEDTGCNPSKISAVCHGHRKHTKNLRFQLLEDYDEKLVR